MERQTYVSTVENLRKRGFDARLVHNKEEARTLIAEYIIPYGTVGFGGSETVKELDIANLAREHRAKVYDHNQAHLSMEEKMDLMRKGLTSDLYMTSANAITIDGKIFNIDGTGNRIAAMTFGPKKVVIVAGINKIVPDDEAAMKRIKTIACPKNATRLEKKTPCRELGYCVDCDSPDRICMVTHIMERKPRWTDITVIIIEEEMGY